MTMFAVIVTQSGPRWVPGRSMEGQSLWDEHASFMDSLVAEGFVVLGGPLGDDGRVLHAVEAGSEAKVRQVLGRDPWSGSHLVVESVDEWTIRLDGRH